MLEVLGKFLDWADEFDDGMVAFFAENLTANKTKPAPLAGYLACLSAAVARGSKAAACGSFASVLLEVCTAALKQSAAAWCSVAVLSSHLLVSLLQVAPTVLEGQTARARLDKLAAYEPFTTLRTSADLPPRAVLAVVSLFTVVIETAADVDSLVATYSRAVVNALLHPTHATRTAAGKALVRGLQLFARQPVWARLVDTLMATFAAVADMAPDDILVYRPSPQSCAAAVLALGVVPPDQDAAAVCRDLLLPSFHSVVGTRLPWYRLQRQLNCEQPLSPHADQLAAKLLAALAKPIERSAVLKALRAVAGDPDVGPLRARLLRHAVDVLDRTTELDNVTEEECGIFYTPEGQLYAEDVLKAGDELSRLHPNSKDYKDKLWEIQMRRELAKRKGETQPKLTKKQIEARNAQLVIESETRARLAPAFNGCTQACDIVESLVAGTAEAVVDFVPGLARALLQRARSRLLGLAVGRTFELLAAVLPPRLAAHRTLLAVATLRCLGSDRCVAARWLAESASSMLSRATRQVWTHTHEDPLPLAGFAYCWPLLACALREYSGKVTSAVLEDALVALHAHASLGAHGSLDRPNVLAYEEEEDEEEEEEEEEEGEKNG